MDIVDRQTRSRMMAGIRGKDTTPEVSLRRALHAQGFRFRLHCRKLPGKPDIVLPKYRAALLVHGCFWHRHKGCRYATNPATNIEFWERKFAGNVERDARAVQMLTASGWRVGIVWECALGKTGTEEAVRHISEWLRGTAESITIPDDVA